MERRARVLCGATRAIDAQRLGNPVAFLSFDEVVQVDEALRLLLDP